MGCVLASVGAPFARAETPPVPEQDPFYAVPGGISSLPNGAVLASRAITAYSGPVPIQEAHAWQVKYKTLDNQGKATATVTTVLVPNAAWTGSGPRPLVSYQVAEDGVGGKCSASYALSAGLQQGDSSGNAENETSEIRIALQRGWAVTAPDYEGPHSAFLGGDLEARETLDALRATLNFKPASLGAGTPLALWGYSGGALATSLAAQMQPSYAPDLKLAGIATGGAVGDLKASFNAFDALGIGGGALIVAGIGLDRAYPSYHLQQYLNAAGKQAFAASQSDCLGDAIGKYPGKKGSDFLTSPDLLSSPTFMSLVRQASPLTRPGTPSAPVYDYHAEQDELAPIGPDRELVARYCAAGVPVQHVEFPGEHFSEVAAGANDAMTFLADRFAGKPPTSTCAPVDASAKSAPAAKKAAKRRHAHKKHKHAHKTARKKRKRARRR